MRLLLLFLLAFGIGSCAGRSAPSSYLEMTDGALVSTHDLRFSLARPEGFRDAPPVTHFPTFHDHPFQVSIGGFV
ncbi:MAG: hypothetical protein HKN20_16535, partial [Gemmatimonadetes bacterium]|nr:hypothetical protein [Gemmatimonadota bacterium]